SGRRTPPRSRTSENDARRSLSTARGGPARARQRAVSRWEHRRGDRAVAGGGGRRPEARRGAQQSRGRLSAGGSPRRRGPRNEARGEERPARESPVQRRPQESVIETL